MLPVLLLVPALLAAAPASSRSPSKRPTDAALRKAYEHNQHTLVEVWGGRRRGTGVIVGATGEIVTSVEHVKLDSATVRVGDKELPARVIAANAALKVAVVSVELGDEPRLAAPAVRVDAPLPKGAWLVGIARGKNKPKPIAGQVVAARTTRSPFVVTDLPLPPGSPLFDPKGRLVAIVVERVGRIGSKALPVGAIQAQVAAAVPTP